jgi:hypothetical protein
MKTIFAIAGLFAFLIITANVAAAIQRNNGIPDVLSMIAPTVFGDPEQEQIAASLVAPFAEPEAGPPQTPEEALYQPFEGPRLQQSVNAPHLHDAAVADWLVTMISEALTFTPQTYAAHRDELNDFFNANGLSEYEAFIASTNILALMQSKDYKLQTFLKNTPLLRTSGVTGDVYKWVYDMPVNLTFLRAGLTDYRDVETGDDFISQDILLRVQLARSLEGGDNGLIIETWEMVQR